MKMQCTNANLTKIYANCGSQNTHCSISKVQITTCSLAFKRRVILRLAIRIHMIKIMHKKHSLRLDL